MFKRILIANRGEIAVRVFRACRELDIETVAIYSTADESALHAQIATRSLCVGPARAADSYLNQDAILSAALATGCDAIHPGYGFLSENPDFADRCVEAGLKYIGPSGDVIRKMGSKAAARTLAQKAGVPVVPGSDGPLRDVEQAKEELLGVIENITSEMTVIFKEQFALIRESFQETFLELFGGGKATLELEDENAVLDCGIEIKVQPPGKALKTLSLLSGGEKAFVAIALYFAILKVHPTPFCVMDEIEAALDEPNVIRVAHYMRRICDKTQFIVITHRRGTMEAADVLYGVTMQERGVSKVLTINMNDMAKELNIKG